MDEPTTSLSGREVDALFEIVGRLKTRGLGVVFVSHWLEEVFAISDRITVLRDGRLVGSRPPIELNHDAVIRMMVGRDVHEVTTQSVAPGPVVLKVEGPHARGRHRRRVVRGAGRRNRDARGSGRRRPQRGRQRDFRRRSL